MTQKRKSKAWIWWIVTAGLLVAYPFSYGPYSFLYVRGYIFDPVHVGVMFVYSPVIWVIKHGPESVAEPLRAYVSWWILEGMSL